MSDLTTFEGASLYAEPSLAHIVGETMPPGNPLAGNESDIFAEWLSLRQSLTPDGTSFALVSEGTSLSDVYYLHAEGQIRKENLADNAKLFLRLTYNLQESGEEIGLTTEELKGDVTGDDVSYQNKVAGLLDEHCVSCHSPDGTASSDFTDAITTFGLKEAIVEQVASGEMPPNKPLGSEVKEIFTLWKEGGYK